MSTRFRFGEWYRTPSKFDEGFDYWPVGIDDKTTPLYDTMQRVDGFGVSIHGGPWEYFAELEKCQQYLDVMSPLVVLPVED